VQGVVDRLSEFRCGQGTRCADARRVRCEAMRASEWPPRLELPRRAAAHRAALRGDATASPVATARTAKLRKPRRRFPAGFNRQRDPSRACDLLSLPPELSPHPSEAKRSELLGPFTRARLGVGRRGRGNPTADCAAPAPRLGERAPALRGDTQRQQRARLDSDRGAALMVPSHLSRLRR